MKSLVIACAFNACLAYTLTAQPAVSFAPVDGSLQGVTTFQPGDANFLPAVNSLVPASGMSLIQPMLPYSLVLRNDSPRKILAACVYFRATGQNGEHGGTAQCYGDFPASKILLAPGEMMLAMPGWSVTTRMPAKPRDLSSRATTLAAARSVSISVDSVVFGTGKLVGPDQLDKFDHYSAKVDARLAVGKTVAELSGQDEELKQFLANKASSLSASFDANTTRTYQGEFNLETSKDAMELTALLTSKGAQAVYAVGRSWADSTNLVTLHK